MKKLITITLLVLASFNASATQGYLTNSSSEAVAGKLRTLCTYNVMGDQITIMLPFGKMCPISYNFNL